MGADGIFILFCSAKKENIRKKIISYYTKLDVL